MSSDFSLLSKPPPRPPPPTGSERLLLDLRPSNHSRSSLVIDYADQSITPSPTPTRTPSVKRYGHTTTTGSSPLVHTQTPPHSVLSSPSSRSGSPTPTRSNSVHLQPRSTSPFQHPLYNNNTSTSSLSSSSSVHNNNRSSSPVTLFTLDPVSPTRHSPRSQPRPKASNPYVQHSLYNQNQVPNHAMSSSRLSRHVHANFAKTTPESRIPSESPVRSESLLSEPEKLPEAKEIESHPVLSQQDTLTVNVMQLPKTLHQHNASLATMVSAPPVSSPRSSVMSVIPPMQNVWLDDDEDDNDFRDRIRKSIRSKHKSTTSVNRHSTAEGTYDLTNVTSNPKRRSRKSFGYGHNEEGSILQKLKSTFSSSPEEVSPGPGSLQDTGPRTSAIPSTSQSTSNLLHQSLPLKHAVSANRTLDSQRLPPARKTIKNSATHSSMRTSASTSPQAHHSRSTASKLLGLLSSKSSKLRKQPKHGSAKNQISPPMNVTHNGHATSVFNSTPVGTPKSQPSRPERPIGAEYPFEAAARNAPSSSASSLYRNSFAASPNGGNYLAADQVSISAESVDEPKEFKQHRFWLSRLNSGGSSRNSLDNSSKRMSMDSVASSTLYMSPASPPPARPLSVHTGTPPLRYNSNNRLSMHSNMSVDSVISTTANTSHSFYDEHRSAPSGLLISPPLLASPHHFETTRPNASMPLLVPGTGRGEYTGLDKVHEEGWF